MVLLKCLRDLGTVLLTYISFDSTSKYHQSTTLYCTKQDHKEDYFPSEVSLSQHSQRKNLTKVWRLKHTTGAFSNVLFCDGRRLGHKCWLAPGRLGHKCWLAPGRASTCRFLYCDRWTYSNWRYALLLQITLGSFVTHSEAWYCEASFRLASFLNLSIAKSLIHFHTMQNPIFSCIPDRDFREPHPG